MIEPSAVWWQAKIPFTEPRVTVDVLTLFKDQDANTLGLTVAYYLHGVRSEAGRALRQQNAAVFQKYEFLYTANQATLAGMLADALWETGIRDAIGVRPPSSRDDAVPYIQSAIARGVLVTDISHCLSRVHQEFRAGSVNDFAAVKSAIRATDGTPHQAEATLVIFDDVLASGRSAAATAEVLVDAGIVRQGSRVVVVAPLHIGSPASPSK